MNAAFGHIDPKLRPRLGIPSELMQLPPADYPGSEASAALGAVEGSDDMDELVDGPPPYGAPQQLGDPRFQTRASSDWGTSSFAADPNEFLGEPTEDDHDWRGTSEGYLD